MLWRLWTLLLAACLPFAPLFAQDSEQVSESSVVGNSVEERTPEALLDEWEARHQQRELVEAQVLLREYHNIFAVEKLGYGRCSWRGPDEWHIELEPSSVTAAAQEARQQPGTPVRRKHGQPYQLAGIDQPFSLACDGDTVELKWGDENRAYPDRARRMNRLEDESAEFGPFEGLFHEWMIPDVCPPWLFVLPGGRDSRRSRQARSGATDLRSAGTVAGDRVEVVGGDSRYSGVSPAAYSGVSAVVNRREGLQFSGMDRGSARQRIGWNVFRCSRATRLTRCQRATADPAGMVRAPF